MEIVSGVASSAQLLAYSHSTFKVLIKLYKQVRDGPASLKRQQSSILVLLSVVHGLQRRPAPTHILTTLLELSTIATEALSLITQSQRKGFLGLSWSAVRHEQQLSEVFASLKDKREVLHLAISVESMSSRPSPEGECETQPPTDPGKMRLRDWKFWRSVKHTDTGSGNTNIIGNGPMADRGVTRIQTNISGSGSFNYIGNVQDFKLAQHHPRPRAHPSSDTADEPPQRPQHGPETSELSEPYSSHTDTDMPTDSSLVRAHHVQPPVPERNPAPGRAIAFDESPVPLITEQSRRWTIEDSSSSSSPLDMDSPSSMGSSVGPVLSRSPGRGQL